MSTIQVFCSSCNSFIPNCFYLCPKFHILCHKCCKIQENQKINLCRICNSMVILYIISYENQCKLHDELILKNVYSFGPVVLLNDFSLSQLNVINSNGECVSCGSSYIRWARCVTCRKCLSSTRIREHYNHDHRNLFICPLPPKATISFILNYETVDFLQLKNLQIFYTTHQSEEINGDKIFSIMATKIPFMIPSPNDLYFVILIWLYSQFHACNVIYTIQAVDIKSKIPVVSFTGQPMDSNFMENLVNGASTIEEFGQYLIMKKSVFNQDKGCFPEAIINVTIDKF